jgi:hypothetical protein
LVALVLVTFACADSQVITNSYATHAEAVRGGAVERGWIPAGLPSGAHEIRAQEDSAALAELLGPQVPIAGQRCDPPARIEWWPLLLRGPLNQAQISATGLRLYRLQDAGLTFAVNWNQRRAYYWSPE